MHVLCVKLFNDHPMFHIADSRHVHDLLIKGTADTDQGAVMPLSCHGAVVSVLTDDIAFTCESDVDEALWFSVAEEQSHSAVACVRAGKSVIVLHLVGGDDDAGGERRRSGRTASGWGSETVSWPTSPGW